MRSAASAGNEGISYPLLTPALAVARGLSPPSAGVDRRLRRLSHAYARFQADRPASNLHGLRDFYGVVHALAALGAASTEAQAMEGAASRLCISMTHLLTRHARAAIHRNFRGAPGSAARFEAIAREAGALAASSPPPMTTELLRRNLGDARARHLMAVSPQGDAACCLLAAACPGEMRDSLVLVGSALPGDAAPLYAHAQLAKIIAAMEGGRQLVLHEHDRVYGSLYDMLN